MKSFIVYLVSLFFCLAQINCFHFYLEGGEKKCFYKELVEGTLLVGKYRVEPYENQGALNKEKLGVNLYIEEVFDNDHRVVNQKGPATGDFTFTALDSGEHRICLQPQFGGWFAKIKTKTTFDIEVGDNTILDSKKTNEIQSLNERIKTLNKKLDLIKKEELLIREREREFRDTSERVNSKAVKYSIIQVIILFSIGFYQLHSLRGFFVKQKIL
ncbi:hypothetical protein PACTADRAFT_47913 [Pachysolen tannophilus NRRL Y-2460]|uniref:GOLD domain-containing protein n=1 Tax=Pachysolen tannophilus NRRL Y-2460 TaxID=669874 RepID=A0A1E4U272_PACTA|nr:hypothetical protein PACTADRAFT_47913 [Pachysolen tannophilus NRRL Y-2460]